MAKREEVTCNVTYSPGARERITQAFVDLYYAILDGVHEGPLLTDKQKGKDKTA